MTEPVGRSVSASLSPGLRAGDLAREPRVFCILGSQRTGSNLLVSLLKSHHEVACHWEVFLDKAVHTLFGGGTYCPKAKHDAPEAASLRDVKRRDTQPEAFLDELLAASRRHYPEASSRNSADAAATGRYRMSADVALRRQLFSCFLRRAMAWICAMARASSAWAAL